jgi:tryptophan 2,3-dioxygenase
VKKQAQQPAENYTEQLKKLQEKYEAMGQDLSSYLDGLLYSDYLTYWDYIHLDTLLSLQTPRTRFKDEMVFIVYHQITELYFRLIRWELEQISAHAHPDAEFLSARVTRINRYFRNLVGSFDIMTEGMEKDQFLKFRMALLPASGFQSAQYRLIELGCTDMINLVVPERRAELQQTGDVDAMLEHLYWRRGATELATGQKTLTLRQFEEKYMELFRQTGKALIACNLYALYRKHYVKNAAIMEKLRELDTLANVMWPLAHLKSAGRYLHKDPEAIRATGGTNWQKYLPPRFQKVIFFPDLWSEAEKAEWGRAAFAHGPEG